MDKPITHIPDLDRSVPFIMGLAYKQFRTLTTHALATQFDITLEMLGALRVLAHLGEVPQQTLSDALCRERSVTKRLVDNCIKRELINVKKSENNKKVRLLVITDKGQQVKEEANKIVSAIVSDYFSPLSDDEYELMLKLSKKLIREDLMTI
ncbi:TPA: MarR family winged helix-turn-helix transcriptional regulator [Photobacterium damselae]